MRMTIRKDSSGVSRRWVQMRMELMCKQGYEDGKIPIMVY